MRAILFCLFWLICTSAFAQSTTPQPRWWKGNLHTHSLWSDGDDFPEMVASWYQERGYNFLAISDHNILSAGMKWMPLDDIVKRSDAGVLDRYRVRFGSEWVETRQLEGTESRVEVRLKPLDEFRCLLERAGEFIMIQGEEISDSAEGKPVHINVSNVDELLRPVGGANVREVMQNNLRAVVEKEAKSGRDLLAHLNHPNFHYAVTAEDLAHVVQEQFFEVYNGHPDVHHLGDGDHPGTERMWDVANTIRLTMLDAQLLLGVATDDTHEYHGKPGARPGRGWVMVRATYLTPEHLLRAMESADFYASSGVVVRAVELDRSKRKLTISMEPQDGVEFTTEFIGSEKPLESGSLPVPEAIGKVFAKVLGNEATYEFAGNELFVRATITSSRPHDDPSFPDQRQQAWTQPVIIGQ